jgi:hypothetical protein
MVPFARSSDSNQAAETDLHQLLDTTTQKRTLSRHDHLYLTLAMLSDQSLKASDRNRINLVFDRIRMGQIELVD